jgi:hypothetical protein
MKKTKQPPARGHMTYEQHLDEVTTLIVEKYDLEDDAAIAMVMRAQADDFFSGHDDDPTLCTLDRAHQDARDVYKKYR